MPVKQEGEKFYFFFYWGWVHGTKERILANNQSTIPKNIIKFGSVSGKLFLLSLRGLRGLNPWILSLSLLDRMKETEAGS